MSLALHRIGVFASLCFLKAFLMLLSNAPSIMEHQCHRHTLILWWILSQIPSIYILMARNFCSISIYPYHHYKTLSCNWNIYILSFHEDIFFALIIAAILADYRDVFPVINSAYIIFYYILVNSYAFLTLPR